MDWITYQETHGIRQQERMREMLKGIKNPSLEQVQAVADSNYPFNQAIKFCNRHSKDSAIMDVVNCADCKRVA